MALATVFFGAFFGLYLLVLLRVRRPRRPPPGGGACPRVSMLVATRNEEATIGRCLHALARLDYPTGQLEILIGDDASTDGTRAVVERFIADKPQFRLLTVRRHLGTARGKSNVLAHLTRAATSHYFLLTDADTAVPPGWVQALLATARLGVGI